jgi:type II secretory pathway component PulK
MKTFNSESFRSGSALLAVMWVVALLSALVATTMLFLREDVDTIDTRRQMFHARLLAEQGLAIAGHPDVKPDDEQLLRHEVEPGVGWIVEMEGEDGRLNPNVLLQRQDRDTWRAIFRAWGLRFDDGEKLLNALIDWVDEDSLLTQPGGAEKQFYNTTGFPFNRPFRSVDEMALVRYMDEVERIYPNWRSWFSVYSSGIVDLNEASAEVIQALTQAEPSMIQRAVSQRAGRDGIRGTKDDILFQDVQTALRVLGITGINPQTAQYLGVQSTVTRIKSRGIDHDFSRTLFAIINRATSPQPGAAPGGVAAILWLGEEDGREGKSTTSKFPALKGGR